MNYFAVRLLAFGNYAAWLTLMLSCCAVVAQQTESPAVEQEPGVGPVFAEGQAQVVPAFEDSEDWIRHDLFVETEFDSDGDGNLDRMHVAVTRPRQTETEGLKLPVIYNTSPYFAGVGGTNKDYFWNPRQELGAEPPQRTVFPSITQQSRRPVLSQAHVRTWVPRGYIVVHSSSPGTGLSQGCPTVGGKNESLAPKAVIDWLCGRAKGYTELDSDDQVQATWCNGKVGMIGTSFNGTLCLAAATTGVDGLEAIIPVAPNTSYYHYYRSHGLIRHPGGYMGEDIDVLYDFINSGDEEMRDHCNCEVRDKEMAEGFDRVTGDYNDFWAGRDYLLQLDNLKAATLMAHAFNDWNVMPEHSVRIHQALKEKGVPLQAYFHQGGHGGEPPMELMNRWFTRYLHGVENGVDEDPRSWITRESDRRTEPTAYPDYPHPEAAGIHLYLHAGGEELGVLASEPPPADLTEALTDNVEFTGKQLAQAESSPHRLLYATAPLQQQLHLSGTARIRITLASSKPAVNLSVWLVALPYTDSRKITDNIITRGWADPQNHRSIRESEPLEPGKFYTLEFDLQPDDQVLPAGQQIGLMVFASDRDFTLWPEPGTELTLNLSETQLTLPVVGGEDAFKKAIESDP